MTTHMYLMSRLKDKRGNRRGNLHAVLLKSIWKSPVGTCLLAALGYATLIAKANTYCVHFSFKNSNFLECCLRKFSKYLGIGKA